MNCPVCNVPLSMMDRQGVEIDYCSKCRGVWLDRGELDKIIERAATATSGFAGTTQPPQNLSGFGQTPPQQPNNPQSGFGQQPNYPNTPQSGFGQPHYPNNQYNQPHYPNTHYGQPHYKKKKHESFLSELFDFD